MLDYIWESLFAWIQTTVLSGLDVITVDLMYAFAPSLVTMDSYFPGLEQMWETTCAVSFYLILFYAIFKCMQNSFLVFTRDYESPIYIILRAVSAMVMVRGLPVIVKPMFDFADIVYWEILEKNHFTEQSDVFSSLMVTAAKSLASEASSTDITSVITNSIITNPSQQIVVALIGFILTVTIAWNYFKLNLEVATRYTVLGVMYYTMPLVPVAFVSKDSVSILKTWMRMLVAELMILGLNVFFISTFRASIISGDTGSFIHYTVHGKKIGGVILWGFIAVSFLKTAQKIDSHLAQLGFTNTQLAANVGGSLLAGGFALGKLGSDFKRGFSKGAFSPSQLKDGFRGVGQQMALNNLGKLGKGSSVTAASNISKLTPSDAAMAVKRNDLKLSGDAAAEYAKKMVPGLSKKNINPATAKADSSGFKVDYKDANGRNARMSFSETNPGGISRVVQMGDMSGYLKDTGTPFDMNQINGGDIKFKDFADEHLNGEDNFIANSGRMSQKDFENSTIGANEAGDGFVIKDENGNELANVRPFNDNNVDNIDDNTLVGAGSDGLYRADFNPEPPAQLPEGYSYEGETWVDPNGNKLTNVNGDFVNGDGEKVEDAFCQDSYLNPEGKYISSDEMNDILDSSRIKNSDYAGNVSYASDAGFTNNDGEAVDISKAGWESTDKNDLYNNKFTGGSATGEQIAEKLNDPTYNSQSYGGLDDNGNELYYDNYSKDKMSDSQLQSAPRYGELPENMNSYYNPETGEFGASSNEAKNFGTSVEDLLDKDYTFSGKTGAEIAKGYIPELRGVDLQSATLDKDSIVVDIQGSDNVIQREQYWSKIPDRAGKYQSLESSGDFSWSKNFSDTNNNMNTSTSEKPSNGRKKKKEKMFFGKRWQ